MDKEHVFFENYAGTWDRDRKENPEILSTLIKLAGLSAGDTVLDAGSGTGILLPYLHEAVTDTGRIEELDYSHSMLEQARQKFSHLPGITYTEKDILKYKLPPEAYDAVLCLNLYPHIAQYKETFIKKMAAALKQGGSLIIMHDIPRRRVNALHAQGGNMVSGGVLPPLDIMSNGLIAAGLTVTVAMDTESFYFIKGEKKQDLPYDQYPDYPILERPAVSENGMPVHEHGHAHPHPHTHSHTQTRAVMNRLSRISGHLEAIKRMVAEGRDCSDILIQSSAVDSALVSVGKLILQDHIDHCIVDAVKENDMEAVDNLKKAITTFIK